MTSSSATLEVRSVTKSFSGLTAVSDVSLTLQGGEFVGLVGPNGAGKSTLLDVLTARQHADSGEVRLNGRDTQGLPAHEMAAKGVGRTFQGGSVFSDFSVMRNLRIGSYIHARGVGPVHFAVRSARARQAIALTTTNARDAARRIGITDILDRRVADLSRGENQMVALGIAIAGRPQFLLLDEPLAGLETREIHRVLEALERLRSQEGVGVLMVEHNLEVVRRTCERLIVLDRGRVLASGSPGSALADPAVQEAYIGAPSRNET